jgi:tight adherence protein B
MIAQLVLVIAVAGAVYFALNWWTSRQNYSRLTVVERANLRMAAEAEAARGKRSLWKRFADTARDRGWRGDPAVLLTISTFAYLILIVALQAFGVGDIVSLALGLPLALLGGQVASITARARYKRAFDRQLSRLFALVAARVKAGESLQTALEAIVRNQPDPMGTEMGQALDGAVGDKDLITAMEKVAEKFPSRAMNLFIAALRLNQKQGTELAPALMSAAHGLEKDFELAAESEAEVSQARAEFFAILAILAFITVTSISSSDGETIKAYLSPMGAVVFSVVGANFALGLFRINRIFAKARGDR